MFFGMGGCERMFLLAATVCWCKRWQIWYERWCVGWLSGTWYVVVTCKPPLYAALEDRMKRTSTNHRLSGLFCYKWFIFVLCTRPGFAWKRCNKFNAPAAIGEKELIQPSLASVYPLKVRLFAHNQAQHPFIQRSRSKHCLLRTVCVKFVCRFIWREKKTRLGQGACNSHVIEKNTFAKKCAISWNR